MIRFIGAKTCGTTKTGNGGKGDNEKMKAVAAEKMKAVADPDYCNDSKRCS